MILHHKLYIMYLNKFYLCVRIKSGRGGLVWFGGVSNFWRGGSSKFFFGGVCVSKFFGRVLQISGGLQIFGGGGVSPNFLGGSSKFRGVSKFLGEGVGLQIFEGSPNFRRGLQFFFRGGWAVLRNTVNVQPVRILLECILVENKYEGEKNFTFVVRSVFLSIRTSPLPHVTKSELCTWENFPNIYPDSCHGNSTLTAITVITWVSGCSGNETWRVFQYVFSTARLLSVLVHSDPLSTDLKRTRKPEEVRM